MGIRSDVFIAVKAVHQDEFKAKYEAWLRDDYGAEMFQRPEGVAFYADDVKWYSDKIDEMYLWLGRKGVGDFIIVTACHDYPESTENDYGHWEDNPWNAERVHSVRIEFNKEEE